MIRKATISDLDEIMDIYSLAREFMKKNNNPNQWGDTYPSRELIEDDINNGICYVLFEGKLIYGVFVLIFGEDPTYLNIYEGNWKSSSSYATIHRIASSSKRSGVFKEAVKFAKDKYDHLRIDTYIDNKVMQHCIFKEGFTYQGIIKLEDGSPRLAYEWINK